MTRTKIWLAAAGTLLGFLGAAWAADALLGLAGTGRLVLWIGLVALGAAAAALVYLYLAPRAAARVPAADQTELAEVDATISAAQDRLRGAGLTETSRIGKLPVVLVMGPGGSTKTTTVVHSGLEPELLAGEVDRGGATVPTAGVNLWYAQGMVFLEAGGKTVDDPARWERVVRRIQPDRLAAALARGVQAPRLAVVCFGCDELLKPGSAEAVPGAARRLRARLAEVSQRLGIRLPVYVLFTKSDRLPYFDDYVRSFSREEAQEVLGATLPASQPPSVGLYAEHQAERVAAAFQEIYHSLALRRVDVLPREAREEIRTGAYEFPRELRKVTDLATQFLVELCKPSHLGVSPFLRGFYFTGVRTTLVSDAPAAARPELAAPTPQVSLGATSVFSAAQLRQASPAAAPAASFGSRQVPEWLFLKRLFREVVLQDQAAMGVTGGGTRVNLVRRGLAGVAAAAALVLAVGSTVSYFQNRALVRDALAAAHGVETLAPAGDEPASVDALRRLDALRVQTERVEGYAREGRPWRLGWGLFTGDELEPELRRLYFDRFERLLWGPTRAELLGSLDRLPAAPTAASEYGEVYGSLKAHLITATEHSRESTPEFLTPVLVRHWTATRAADPERLELARRQFDFFARGLPHGNPYREAPREGTVAGTREFLSKFADAERFYQAMLSEAAKKAGRDVDFNRAHPGSEAVLRGGYVVPGAFTREGWAYVLGSRDAVDRLFGREDWVLGSRAVTPGDRARLAGELRSRYAADYVRHWQAYLDAAAPVGFSGTADAAGKVTRLARNDSPLLRVLALASRHTAVDSAQVGQVFQPVHAVVHPDSTDRPTTAANQAYMQALAGLASALTQVASAPAAARPQALGSASMSVGQVEGEARRLAQGFRIEGEAGRVGSAVQRLLLAPASGALAAVNAATAALPDPAAEEKAAQKAAAAASVNQQGADFCRTFRSLAGKYPFNRRAAAEARADEVTAVFGREGGALWSLYDGALQPLLLRQGSSYAARAGAEPAPTGEFVRFFSRAASVSGALFGDTGGPELGFSLRPQTSAEIPEVAVTMDGRRYVFTRTVAASRSFVWSGARAQGMRVAARINGAEVALLEGEGTWGVFRVFGRGDWERTGEGRYTVRWRIPQSSTPLAIDVYFDDGVPPLLNPDYLGGLGCVPRIVR